MPAQRVHAYAAEVTRANLRTTLRKKCARAGKSQRGRNHWQQWRFPLRISPSYALKSCALIYAFRCGRRSSTQAFRTRSSQASRCLRRCGNSPLLIVLSASVPLCLSCSRSERCHRRRSSAPKSNRGQTGCCIKDSSCIGHVGNSHPGRGAPSRPPSAPKRRQIRPIPSLRFVSIPAAGTAHGIRLAKARRHAADAGPFEHR